MLSDVDFFTEDGPFWSAVYDWHEAKAGGPARKAGDALEDLVRERIDEALNLTSAPPPAGGDEYLREIALEKAVRTHPNQTSEQIVGVARQYLAFLNGEDE